jgi:hypothetical protein
VVESGVQSDVTAFGGSTHEAAAAAAAAALSSGNVTLGGNSSGGYGGVSGRGDGLYRPIRRVRVRVLSGSGGGAAAVCVKRLCEYTPRGQEHHKRPAGVTCVGRGLSELGSGSVSVVETLSNSF